MNEDKFKTLAKQLPILSVAHYPYSMTKHPIVDDVVKLSQRLPYTYDDVYRVYAAHGKDIEETKRCFWIED